MPDPLLPVAFGKNSEHIRFSSGTHKKARGKIYDSASVIFIIIIRTKRNVTQNKIGYRNLHYHSDDAGRIMEIPKGIIKIENEKVKME